MGKVFEYDRGRSWMYPYLKEKDIVEPADQRAIARWMLKRFGEMMLGLQGEFAGRLHVVNTQGTLDDNDWLNEIHPTPTGFKKIAEQLYKKIKEVLG